MGKIQDYNASVQNRIDNIKNLDQLSRSADNAIFFKHRGELKVSKFPVGHKFLAVFSKRVRKNIEKGSQEVNDRLKAAFDTKDKLPDRWNVTTLRTKLSSLKNLNQASADKLFRKLQMSEGSAGNDAVKIAKETEFYKLGLKVDTYSNEDKNFLGAVRSEVGEIAIAYRNLSTKIREHSGESQEVVDLMSEIPSLKALFDGSAQVREGYTVGVHTKRVFEQFDSQKKFFHLDRVGESLNKLPGFKNTNIEHFMKTVIALHDIGKSLGKNASEQHHYTIPILHNTMIQMGFSREETRLAETMIDHDLLGELQRKKLNNVSKVRDQVKQMAEKAGIPPLAMFRLQKLFYISDSSSYDGVKNRFMVENENGRLAFKSDPKNSKEDRIGELTKAFLGEIGYTEIGDDYLVESPVPSLPSTSESITKVYSEIHVESVILDTAPTEGTLIPNFFRSGQRYLSKNTNAFDIADAVISLESSIREKISKMGDTPISASMTQRLKHAVDMAKYAKTLQADNWKPEFAESVIESRMEIRAGGIVGKLPSSLAPRHSSDVASGRFYDTNGKKFDHLRGENSISEEFYDLMRTKGGSPELIENWGFFQAGDSWNITSQAVKYFLYKSRDTPKENYYFKDGIGKAKEYYENVSTLSQDFWQAKHEALDSKYNENKKYRKDGGFNLLENVEEGMKTDNAKLFDKTFHMWMAMQMEMLENVDLPGSNKDKKTIRVYRTENKSVINDISNLKSGGTNQTMNRGAAESGSLSAPLSAYGTELTIQDVPFHRIAGTYLLQMPHHENKGAFHSDMQREVLFMGEGQMFDYTGSWKENE